MPYSILLLEDNDPLRASLREVLRSWGFDVFATGVGREAIELARTRAVDFSLLDLHLPGMAGSEVLRVIRHDIGPIPSIMMSGEATAEEASLVRSMGAFDFLRKPLDIALLRTSFNRLIQHHFESNPGDRPQS